MSRKVLMCCIGIAVVCIVILITIFMPSNNGPKYIVNGTIIDVGSCGGGEGFFSGDYGCKVAVNVDGVTQYWSIYGKAIVGQHVSRQCYRKLSEDAVYCGVGR